MDPTSPPIVTGSAGNGESTPTSSHNPAGSSAVTTGISGGKVVTPIAALELKATPGPAVSMPYIVAVDPKRQHRHSKSVSTVESSSGIGGQPTEDMAGLQDWEWMTMSL